MELPPSVILFPSLPTARSYISIVNTASVNFCSTSLPSISSTLLHFIQPHAEFHQIKHKRSFSIRTSSVKSSDAATNATNNICHNPVPTPTINSDQEQSIEVPTPTINNDHAQSTEVPTPTINNDHEKSTEGFWRRLFSTESTDYASNSRRNITFNAVGYSTVNNDSNPSTSNTKKRKFNEGALYPDSTNTDERVLRRQHRVRVREQIRQANAAYEESWEKHLPKPYKPKLDNNGWRKWPWVRMPWSIAGYKENAHIICDIWTYDKMLTRLPKEHPIYRIKQLDWVEM